MRRLKHILRAALLLPGLALSVTAAVAPMAMAETAAAAPSYRLRPLEIAPGAFVLEGAREDFTPANGGNIVNAGFIVTAGGVVVIDTGPSALYGAEMRAAIAAAAPGQPVVLVLNTHHHPDHMLGNQAFEPAILAATAATIAGIQAEGEAFAANLYRLLGHWMRDTVPTAPAATITPEERSIGGHRLRLLALAGHTGSDLALFDATAGVLWAGDLVFWQRAPTTPHADPAAWLAALDALEALPFTVLVPGHGPVARDAERLAPIAQTRDWLRWLDATLRAAAAGGLSMGEAMRLPIPDRFAGLALARQEFERSVIHLYPALERQTLENTND